MKKLLLLLSLSSLLLIKNLTAQEASMETPENTLAVPTPLHLGINNGYPIGSESSPVTLQEYVIFLTMHNALDVTSYEDHTIVSNTPDSYITSTKHINSNSEDYYFTYTLRPNSENIIIDAVSSPQEQEWFQSWRAHPTAAELCQYINNTIEDLRMNTSLHAEENTLLEQCYPQALKRNWFFYVWRPSLFEDAFEIAYNLSHRRRRLFTNELTDGNKNTILKVEVDKSTTPERYYLTVVPGCELLRPEGLVFNFHSIF